MRAIFVHFRVKAAKEIARKEGLGECFDAVGPSPFDAAEWQPCLEATAGQLIGREEFPAGGCPDTADEWCVDPGEVV